MTADTPEDRLFDEAVGIAIRLQGDPANAVTRDLARRWRDRSPDHARIWAEVIEIHGLTGQVMTPAPHQTRDGVPNQARRALLLGGLAVTGTLGATLAAPALWRRMQADRLTGRGQVLGYDQPDGSRITLGPSSAIAADAATLRLIDGMILCETAGTPLTVLCADRSIILSDHAAVAIGADIGTLSVEVAAGSAVLRDATGAMTVAAGDWASLRDTTLRQGRTEGNPPALWREDLVVARADRIDTLVARIGRWMPGQIIVTSATLGAREVSGIYDLRDPMAALRAAVLPWSGQVRQVTPLLTFVSAA